MPSTLRKVGKWLLLVERSQLSNRCSSQEIEGQGAGEAEGRLSNQRTSKDKLVTIKADSLCACGVGRLLNICPPSKYMQTKSFSKPQGSFLSADISGVSFCKVTAADYYNTFLLSHLELLEERDNSCSFSISLLHFLLY